MSAIQQLLDIEQDFKTNMEALASSEELDALRVSVLGKKGSLTAILKSLKEFDASERAEIGKRSNELRIAVETALEAKKEEIKAREMSARFEAGKLDISLPGRRRHIGTQHLISRVRDEVIDVFLSIGYSVAEGPEVELEFNNFTALNHAPEHPARLASDTFYVHDRSGDEYEGIEPSGIVLRTHTSPVQVRTMLANEPPIAIIAPGKVYRRDIADPTHLPQFTQIEGLVVDEGITFAELKGTLDFFVKQVFGPERKTRFRPHFFPFTEPSAEVDISCGICGGEGCRFCSQTGWIEILGCGMVDPNVFEFCNIDSKKYTGFAFGMGVERIAALKYDIPDLRMLIDGDMRFLTQF